MNLTETAEQVVYCSCFAFSICLSHGPDSLRCFSARQTPSTCRLSAMLQMRRPCQQHMRIHEGQDLIIGFGLFAKDAPTVPEIDMDAGLL